MDSTDKIIHNARYTIYLLYHGMDKVSENDFPTMTLNKEE